jgi:TonB family protein
MQSLLLECTIRASLVAVSIGVILRILRVKDARLLHTVWAGVVLLMLALPIWTAWGPRAVVRVLTPATPSIHRPELSQARSADSTTGRELTPAVQAETPTFSAPNSNRTALGGFAWTWRDVLAAVYLLGFGMLLTRLTIGTARAQLLVRRADSHEGVLTSGSCTAPITVGMLNPIVILPEAWKQWPQTQVEAVLTHENEHARRRDPLVQWLALFNRAVFWFHPLAWWLERRLSALAEEACDAAVLSRGHDPYTYSECLLAIARTVQQTGWRVNVAGMAMSGIFLPQRIRRIMEGGAVQRISRGRLAWVVAACVGVATVFTVGTVGYAQAQTHGQTGVPSPDAIPHPDGRGLTGSRSPDAFASTASPKVVEPEAVNPRPLRKSVLLAQVQTSPTKPNPNATNPDRGSLSGTVEDPSGGRVLQCAITMRDRNGATVANASPDAGGFYELPFVPIGHYSVEFEARGFARLILGAEIEGAKTARMDARLAIGQTFESLTVSARRPAGAGSSMASSASDPGSEPARVQVGGNVRLANLIKRVNPVYPAGLKEQGLEGIVRIASVISREGAPINPRVLNANEVDSRFADVAMEAVRQWRYSPALLNGNPVEVLVTITMEFHLEQ